MAKAKNTLPFTVKWLPKKAALPIVDFLGGAPKKPMFPPKSAIGERPPRRRPILKITGRGTGPLGIKLPIMETPRVRRIKDIAQKIVRGPQPIGVRLGLRPARKKPVRWRQTAKGREQAAPISELSLPPGVEAIIDLTEADKGLYRLMRATRAQPGPRSRCGGR